MLGTLEVSVGLRQSTSEWREQTGHSASDLDRLRVP